MLPGTPSTKPYPWKCGQCGQRTVEPVTIDYSTAAEHEGRAYEICVPQLSVARCATCGELVLDDEANARISDALRRQLGLLMPGQIRANREHLGLSQKQLADSIAVAEPTLARWETGSQIQPRSADRLLRLYFGSEQVRMVLADEAQLAALAVPI